MTQSTISPKTSIHEDERPIRDGIPIEKGTVLTEEFIQDNRELIQQYLDLWMQYPDIFIDMITPIDSDFRLFFYQRIFLRACMRFRYVFGTFTRAYSKSFLAILSRIIQCILLPGTKTFVAADVKGSGVRIMSEKVDEIFAIWPLLKLELLPGAAGKHESTDYIELKFRNGSMFDCIGVTKGTRGIRRTSGVFEEAALFDADEVNERVLPTLNISRRGSFPGEPIQSQVWVTSAGTKSCYAYEKLVEFAAMSVVRPRAAYVCGGDYRLPVRVGLMDKEYMEDMKASSSFKEDSFSREMMSNWTGNSNEAWINIDRVARHRKLLRAERKNMAGIGGVSKDDFYIMSVDVGRFSANTAIHVFRVHHKEDYMQKYLVFTHTISDIDRHFAQQAVEIKKLYNAFQPRRIIIDGNGNGAGLTDMLILTNTDMHTGINYGPLGSENDDHYLKIQPTDAPRVLYIIKPTQTDNKEYHANCFSQLTAGRVTFLAPKTTVRAKLMQQKKGKKMGMVERAEFLRPYEMTDRLFDELGNLKQKITSNGIDLEQISRRIYKDRFSAFEYGLWCIKEYEEKYAKEVRRKNRSANQLIAHTAAANKNLRDRNRGQRERTRRTGR